MGILPLHRSDLIIRVISETLIKFSVFSKLYKDINSQRERNTLPALCSELLLDMNHEHCAVLISRSNKVSSLTNAWSICVMCSMELEPTGLSAGCVMGYTHTVPPREVRRECSSVQHCWMHLLCTRPSNTAAQLEETTAPAGKRGTVCASTLNFLAGVCEAATSPLSCRGNTKTQQQYILPLLLRAKLFSVVQ